MNSRFKKILQVVIPLIVGVGILYLLFQNESAKYLEDCALKAIPDSRCSFLDKIWADMKSTNKFWILVVLVIFIISNISRALRWQMMLRVIGVQAKFWNSFFSIMAGYLINLGIPRTGEFARAGLLVKYESGSFDKIFGTIVTGRALDFLMLFSAIALGFLLEYDTLISLFAENESSIATLVSYLKNPLVIVGLFLGVLIFVAVLFSWIFKSTTQVAQKLKGFVLGIFEGVMSIRKVTSPLIFVFHTILIWICYYLMTRLCFFAFSPTAHLDSQAGLVTFIFGSLGIVFPSPGGMGSFHFLIMEAIQIYGIDSTDAFSFANILYFSIQIFCNIIFGFCAFLFLPLINKTK